MKLLEFAGDEGGYLTPAQAAPYMGYSVQTVRRMCAAKQIKRLRRGGEKQAQYKIHRSTIAAWLEAQRAAS